MVNQNSYAYQEGKRAAENGCNINNSYPFTGSHYYDWLDGYRSVKK